MFPKHILLIFLLAVIGTDFLVAMHPSEASAASSSNTETEPHHLDISYEGPVDHVWNESGQKHAEFTFVDMQEQKVVKSGYHLEVKAVKIRNGKGVYITSIDDHKSPYAKRIRLELSELYNQDLKRPKDLEGIELHVEYGFGIGENRRIRHLAKLSNGTNEKEVIVKIPKMENSATEKEREVIKGIFIGGYKFRVEVQKDGNAEIKFEKNLTPGTTKFTLDYSKFPSGKGQIVRAPHVENCQFERISLAMSTFNINWVKSNIKEVEELRTVRIGIWFKLKDGKTHKLTSDERGREYNRYIPFRDLPYDTLGQIYAGGEATIHLSLPHHGNDEIVMGAANPVTKPNSSPDGKSHVGTGIEMN